LYILALVYAEYVYVLPRSSAETYSPAGKVNMELLAVSKYDSYRKMLLYSAYQRINICLSFRLRNIVRMYLAAFSLLLD
jgi:hypothetical protein